MKNSRKSEVKVGILTIIAIILVVWVIGWAKNINPFDEKVNLNISFDSVAGLEPGDPVALNGVKKGYVNFINISEDGVIVNVVLDKNIKIKEDAEFSVMMLDLMGGKIIQIKQGYSDRSMDFKVLQKGKFAGDVSTAMAALSSVQSDLIDLVHQLKIAVTGINKFAGDEVFLADMKSSFTEMKRTITNLNSILNENKEGFKNLIDSGNEFLNGGNELISDTKEPLKNSITQLNSVLVKSDSLLTKLNNFSDEIKSGKNNIGKIVYDEQIVNDMKKSLEQLKKLTEILLEQIQDKGINVDANIDLF